MNKRIINLLLLLSSLVAYLEWGGGNHAFMFEAELELFFKAIDNPLSVLHPLVLIPFMGQLVLIITLFQNEPDRRLTFTGIGAFSLIMAFVLLSGILSANYKIVLSVIPFIITAVVAVKYNSRK
jgi:hypothetical protein